MESRKQKSVIGKAGNKKQKYGKQKLCLLGACDCLLFRFQLLLLV